MKTESLAMSTLRAPPASHSPMSPSSTCRHGPQQSLDERPALPSTTTITEPGTVEPMRLRGGGCFNCCVGRLHVESGPCVCTTKSTGLACCIPCIVIFPVNAVFGAVFGLVNCLACQACSDWTCVLFSPTPETEGMISNPGTYK